jgi:K+-sensing histidine kinase KdpD
MLESLLQGFILTGITILVTLFFLHLQSDSLIENMDNLSQSNKLFNFDVLKLIEHSWPFFNKAGFIGISYQINWFGSEIEYQFGKQKGDYLEFNEQLDESILIKIQAYQGKCLGEKKHFKVIFWQTFLHLMRMDLLIKINAIYVTEKQLQKYNTFLLHDMKNIAQFVTVLHAQLNSVTQESEKEIVPLLQNVLPEILKRAERIILTVTENEKDKQKKQPSDKQYLLHSKNLTFNLAQQVQQVAELHNVNLIITGADINVKLNKALLDQVLDNLISNYNHHGSQATSIKIHIETTQDREKEIVRMTLNSPTKVTKEQYIHLFEPFWSSSDHGMGIGLYQCKTQLNSMNSLIKAHYLQDKSLQFIIQFPI